MVQGKAKRLPSVKTFIAQLARNIIFGILLIAIALLVGMWGYHKFEPMSWVEAFLNASIINPNITESSITIQS